MGPVGVRPGLDAAIAAVHEPTNDSAVSDDLNARPANVALVHRAVGRYAHVASGTSQIGGSLMKQVV